MKRKLATAKKDDSIVKAAKEMSKKHVSSLIVVHNRKPIGIITNTDILKRVVAKNKKSDTTLVKDVMTKKLVKAKANITFTELTRKMRQHKIKHILITDKGKMVGVITSTDIVKLMSGK